MRIWEPLGEWIYRHLTAVCKGKHISIRDAGKILSTAALVASAPAAQDGKLGQLLEGRQLALVFLIVSSILKPEIYRKFLSCEITEKDINDYFSSDSKHEYFQKILDAVSMWTYISKNGFSFF